MTEEKNLKDFIPNVSDVYYKQFDNIVSKNSISEEEVVKCLKNVMDPEIPVNIYDLGLIYSIKILHNNVSIEMTLTNPNCPVAGQMPENVGKSIESLNGIKSIEVKLVWSPSWNKDLMSEDAKLALDIF